MTELHGGPRLARRTALNLVWILLATDAALLVLHLATGWSVFDLDREGNLSSWYSSAKLLGIALLSAAIYATAPIVPAGRRLWLVSAVIFLGLSADESASLHESLARGLLELPVLAGLRSVLTGGDALKSSFAWVWLFLPLILVTALFLVYLFVRGFEGRPEPRALCFAGIACLLAAVALEAVVTGFPPVAEWGAVQADRYRLLTTIEESAELMGITLLFAAVALVLVRARPGGKAEP